jgi:FAD/FMN-containing dehydrogenase
MTATHARHAPISIPALRNVLSGQVIAPDDAAYDRARRVFYGGIDRRPVVIVRPTDSTTDGGILLDLADLRALKIDPTQRTAWAQTGLTAGAYTTAANAHGLATGFGDTASVGIGGLTLGGGIGLLVRKHGLTIDDLLAAELVTADGQLLQVDADHHRELFWAIRGGGGNFGVATGLQYRLHPLDHGS